MRIIGIDFGDKRIGIAVCDPLGFTAQPLETIQFKGMDDLLTKIVDLGTQYNAELFVVGYPLNLNGSEGVRAEKTNNFIELLKERTSIKIIKWDERLTTTQAIHTLNETNVRGKKRKDIVDAVAASLILQNYLDQRIESAPLKSDN